MTAEKPSCPSNLTQGYVLILDRESAKQFFGLREDGPRLAFLRDRIEQADSASSVRTGGVLNMSVNWQALHRCLGDGTFNPVTAEPPLGAALLGGRQMYQAGDAVVSMLRPDMVPVVAVALASLDAKWIENRLAQLQPPPEAEAADLVHDLDQLAQFYRLAAETRGAVVFAAW